MSDTNTQEIMDYMREIKRDMVKRMDELDKKIDKNHIEIKNGYVTKETFDAKFTPIQKIVYGLVGAVLLAFVTALMGLVIISGV